MCPQDWDPKSLSISFSGESNVKRPMEKGPPILDKLISSHFSNMNARLYPEAFMSMSGSKSEQSGVYGGHLLWVLIVRQPGLKL